MTAEICLWLYPTVFGSLTPPPSIDSADREERRTQIPADQGIADFGPLPRERYPLVAVLTLAEPEATGIVSQSHVMPWCSIRAARTFPRLKWFYNLGTLIAPFVLLQVASLTVIHVPDDKYSLSARVLFQYLLTSHGNMFELKVRRILDQANYCRYSTLMINFQKLCSLTERWNWGLWK